MNTALKKAITSWSNIAPIVAHPSTKKEFDLLVARLDEILDIVGEDEKHPLMGLVEIMSNSIAIYEHAQHQKSMGKGVDALRYLMKSHHLHQSDLTEIASQGVLSEILNGKRQLNLRQIKALAARFNVSIETFIEETSEYDE